jgi:hypothetical protein
MIPADRINLHFTGDFHALTTTTTSSRPWSTITSSTVTS